MGTLSSACSLGSPGFGVARLRTERIPCKKSAEEKNEQSTDSGNDVPVLCRRDIDGCWEKCFDYTLNTIDGQPAPLSAYKGKVAMLVNVASRLRFSLHSTRHWKRFYEKYKDRGFVIVGIPANNFGAQEPGTNQEIKTFCQSKYNVTFPMMSKVSVKGDDHTPLYRYLTDKTANPKTGGDIQWNFTKFLVGPDGQIITRFEPKVTPDSPEVTGGDRKCAGLAEALRHTCDSQCSAFS